MLETAEERVKWGEKLKQERAPYEPEWRQIAKFMRPLRAEIGQVIRSEGGDRHAGLFDTTAIDAMDNFGAGMFGTMTNPSNRWFSYAVPDPELNRFHTVREWLDAASAIALASFRPSVSPFYGQAVEWFLDLGGFGNGPFFSDIRRDRRGFIDQVRSLGECYIDVNENGEVDRLVRRYRETAQNLVSDFGTDKVPEDIRRKAEDGDREKLEVQHSTFPNKDFDDGARVGPRSMRYRSTYDLVEKGHNVSEGFFDDFPWMWPRWAVAANEKYGRGPAAKALPHARVVNAMSKTNVVGGQRMAQPPLLAPDEGKISVIRAQPDRVTYGGVTPQGKPLLMPLNTGANVPISLELAERERESIRTAMLFTLMQLVGRTGMTATEVIERTQERFRLMGPYIGRIQAEGLAPLLRRRFNLLMKAGAFPPPPPELRGKAIEVEYLSPMAQAQKSSEAAGVLRTLEVAQSIAAIKPEIVDKVNWDRSLQFIQEANGAPASILNSDEEVKALRQARQRQQALVQGAAVAEQGAGALEKFARATGAGQTEQAA